MEYLPDPVAPSKRLPLMSGAKLQLANAVKNKASPLAITRIFPSVNQELRQISQTHPLDFSNTIRDLESACEGSGAAWELLHSMPSDALQSTVLNTIAYDTCRSDKTRLEGLPSDGGGVYIVGISVAARNGMETGEFLSTSELEVFVTHLQRYRDAHRQLGEDGHLDEDEEEFAYKVDHIFAGCTSDDSDWEIINDDESDPEDYAVTDDDTPFKDPVRFRFIRCNRHAAAVSHMIASYEQRIAAAKQCSTSRDTRTLQSPIYVGCSSNIRRRLESYRPSRHNKSTFHGVNHLYGLTMSILAFMNLKPRHHGIAVIRTWQRDQMPIAERLVCALAGANAVQGGFNIRECGQAVDKQTDESLQRGERCVFVTHKRYMMRNIQLSQADIDKVEEYNAAMATLARDMRTHEEEMDCEEIIEGIGDRVKRYQEKIERVRGFKRGLVSVIHDYQAIIDVATILVDVEKGRGIDD